MDCLLLNSTGNPVNLFPLSTVPWHEAIRLVFLEKAVIIAEYSNWEVHSVTTSMKVPAVLMLKEHHRIKPNVCYSKYSIFLRDGFQCQYCKKALLLRDCTLDHVIPKSHGGKTTWENLTTSCSKCNAEKGNNVKIIPKQPPHKPDYWELVNKRKKFPFHIKHESWNSFLY